MKIRNGFVSNSSSSSFIVHKGDVDLAKSYGLKLIPVKLLKECNIKLEKLQKTKVDIMKELPDFLRENQPSYYERYGGDDVLGVMGLDDDDFITKVSGKAHDFSRGMKTNQAQKLS